jgi:protein-S-isoprenylcysteine O-methyltransferase Ste14
MPPVENSGMEVTFTFSREDYLHYIDFWTKRNGRARLRKTIRVFCLLFAGYVVLFLLSNMPVVFAIGLGALLATVCISLLHWLQRRRMRRVRESALGQRTTRIGPEGIFGKFSHFEVLNYWQGITEIAEDASYLFFFTSGSTAHVVPKRAFATADGLEQFRKAATSYWKSGRG